jgi:thioredoxin reductase (NADPH)
MELAKHHDLNEVAFPKLSDEEIKRIEKCGCAELKRYNDGDSLIKAGERESKFQIINSGEVDIFDDSDGRKMIATLSPGEFTGDVALLIGGPSLITGISKGPSEAYSTSVEGLRELMNRDPELGDIILSAFIARRDILREAPNFTGLRVIGSCYSADTNRIRELLSKNRILFTWLDVETDPQVEQLLKRLGMAVADSPIVAWGRKLILRNPSNEELANVLGIRQPIKQDIYDLVIVGAGPAGLAASVYASSEGLSTLVLERSGPGGQASRSMRIENYLGFPTGITGIELADRAVVQAGKFGAVLSIPSTVVSLSFQNRYPVAKLDDGTSVTARALLIATGVDYRRLSEQGCEPFEGAGVFYEATPNEEPICRGNTVVVVGGGNSAGQATVYLATISKVILVILKDSLYEDMSSYLARRIENNPNVQILLNTEVSRILGVKKLTEVELRNLKNGEIQKIQTPAMFSFIGAAPRTDWLPEEIERDEKGYVKTGYQLQSSPHWYANRQPSFWRLVTPESLLLETSGRTL